MYGDRWANTWLYSPAIHNCSKPLDAISPKLAEHGIVVFEQGQGASPHALLESFKSTDQAVLLGTRAFWEGVDVPGEALSVLAIIKLPFAVPNDPIISARSETFENPFYEYTIPEAILTFRQGFGRLIRSHEDHGVVVIFDKRVISKQYGKMFIDSLPQCTVEVGPLEQLPAKPLTGWGFEPFNLRLNLQAFTRFRYTATSNRHSVISPLYPPS